jgi:hypothetical protein
VAHEEHAKEIVYFSFIPVCSIVKAGDTGNWRRFICICLDSDPRVMTNTEQVVDNFKSLVSGWKVNSSDISDLREFGRSIVYVLVREVPPMTRIRITLHFRNENTGMTPEGEIYITNSSFQTENCCTYFGRQPISHAP